MLCYVITKNSTRGILTKNLVAFKTSDGVKDEKLQCFFLGWGWGWGAWIVCIFKAGGSWQEKGGGVFEEVGVLIPQCTL